ncbi:MAG: 50S ribosomal protein L25 [Bacteroidia bacterium]|nr:50S ribosomal protein L25 [Bacteroidia bacterium]
MKTIELQAAERPNVGKRATRITRRSDNVPAVIYHNSKARHIEVAYREMQRALYTSETYIVKVNVAGELVSTIVRDAQFHPVTERIQHVDFLQVTDDKPVELKLPVRLVGTPVGVTKGGKMVTKVRSLKVRGIPSQLPDQIEVNVSSLDLGGTIKVKDASIPNVEVLASPSTAIASVEIPRALRGK